MKRIRTIFSLLMLVGLSAPSIAQETITISHTKGETTLAKYPKKVAITDLSALETYHELGIPVAGVTDMVPAYLDVYNDKKYAKLGNAKTPDIQAIAALKPDLIIVGGRQGSHYDSLAMIAPTVIFGTDTEDFWNSFEEQIKTIASLHGKEELAEQKLAALRNKRTLVQAKAQNDSKKTVLAMHINGRFNPSGPESRFGFPYDVLDLKPAYIPAPEPAQPAAVSDGEAPQRARTQAPKLAEINPDYLLIFDRNTGVKGVMPNEADIINDDVKATNAYKAGKVFILPGWIWYLAGSGLISVDQKITDIGEKLYGLKF